jgi:hypothetical protein
MKDRWRILVLILWSVGILFPFYFMHRFSLIYKTRFDWAFKSGLPHSIMHIFLYAVLAWLISSVFSIKKRLISTVIVILVVVAVSILQELIQFITLNSPVGLDDVFDVFVDVSGAVIGIIVFRWKWSGKERHVK